MTATIAGSMRLSPSLVLRQPLSASSLAAKIKFPAASNAIGAITRRAVHVDQYLNDKEEKNNNKDSNNAANAASRPQARNRSRRSRSKQQRLSLDEKNVPSYKEFVHRFTVLSLYRGFLKCIRDSMPHNQDDLRAQVRKEFQIHKHDTDPFTVKQNISEGQRRFEELKEFTGQSNKFSGDSWINIQDPDDPRGRVGTGWPWAK